MGATNPFEMLYNLGQAAFYIMQIARYAVAALAIGWALLALLNLYTVSSATGGQPSKLFTSRSQPTVGSSFLQLLLAALLFSTAWDLTPIVLSASIFEGDTTSIQAYNSFAEYKNSLFQYDGNRGDITSNGRAIIQQFILMSMRVIGFIAVIRGIKIFHDISSGLTNKTSWNGLAFILFGTLAFNFWWTYSLIVNTLGFDIFSLIG